MSDSTSTLFSKYGIELEYMIVQADTLDIAPICDRLIEAEVGSVDEDVERGAITWSNELALHVVEFKTTEPPSNFAGQFEAFQSEVRYANEKLKGLGCRLLPTGMHPWMNPSETKLWPHSYNEVYAAFDRIFNCSGHGWGNLQSVHLNLPFDTEDEFVRLHTAIRLILPLLPALAASSPIADSKPTGSLDTRLTYYGKNSKRIPSVSGRTIPEAIRSKADYHEQILGKIYADLAPHDPEGILQHEWSNARGAIARFTRGAIEIRVLDIQECPEADMAILQFIVELLKGLTESKWADLETQLAPSQDDLVSTLQATIKDAEAATISSVAMLEALGFEGGLPMNVSEVLAKLAERCVPKDAEYAPMLRQLLESGTLARRISAVCGSNPSREQLKEVYLRLAECLEEGKLFQV